MKDCQHFMESDMEKIIKVKARKRFIPFKADNHKFARFIKEKCRQYFDQLIPISPIQVDNLSPSKIQTESQPQFNITMHQKKAPIILTHKNRNSCEGMEKMKNNLTITQNSKIRAKSSKRKKKHEIDFCTPLQLRYSESLDTPLTHAIQVLRARKENQKKRQVRKMGYQVEEVRMKPGKENRRIEGSGRERSQCVAYSYTGTPIPINYKRKINRNNFPIQFKVLNQNEFNNKKRRSRTQIKQREKPSKFQQFHINRQYQQCQLQKVQDSKFLKNFTNLKPKFQLFPDNKPENQQKIPENPKKPNLPKKSFSVNEKPSPVENKIKIGNQYSQNTQATNYNQSPLRHTGPKNFVVVNNLDLKKTLQQL